MLFEDESTFDSVAFEKEVRGLPGDNVLLSNENFVGQSLYWNYGNRSRIADRLKAALPNATIILFLRNQPDMLRSLYEISLQDKETAWLSDFVHFTKPEYDLETYRNQPAVDLFEYAPLDTYHAREHALLYHYSPLIDIYKSRFSKVEILLFEDFVKQPEIILRRLIELFEIPQPDALIANLISLPPVNQGVNQQQAIRLQRLNRWYHVLYQTSVGRAFYVRAKRRILRNKKSGESIKWTPDQFEKLREIYAEDNRLIHEKYPEIGLDNYGKKYFLE